MSETGRLLPNGHETVPAASKNCGYCVVIDCACIVRASCLPPPEGTRGTKGTGESQRANPPPPTQSKHKGHWGKRGNREGKSEQKGSTPPPCIQVPRRVLASCPQRACPRGKDNTNAPIPPTSPSPLPPPPQKKTRTNEALRGPRRGCPEGDEGGRGNGGGGHRGEHGVSESDVRQAVRAKSRLAQHQPEPGPVTVVHCASAGKGRGRERGTSRARKEPGRAERSARRGENEGTERKG